MIKINSETIYDPKSGIVYKFSISHPYTMTRDEAEKEKKTFPIIGIYGMNNPSDTAGWVIERNDAHRFWAWLEGQAEQI
jgi:hypothetical protein